MKNVLVLHGPNLNLLGSREPEVYGRVTLGEINRNLHELAAKNQIALSDFQSNSESALVDRVQQARTDGVEFIIINPASRKLNAAPPSLFGYATCETGSAASGLWSASSGRSRSSS